MAWSQVRNFDINKMGTKPGWCLQNCRLGFGITSGTYPSAKADMEAQRANGTLHPINTLPKNVAVPIYVDTASKYEHVIVSDHGIYYSDGKRLSSLSGLSCFGWGECCDGARVVKWTDDPQPTPGFLPAKGYWKQGDKDDRIATMASWMRKTFPAYTSAKALGPIFGPYLRNAVQTFQKRTGLVADGMVGPKTYAKMKAYGFTG